MNQMQAFIASLGGGCFLRETQMPELIKLDRLCPVLVRCGGKRFTCAAQDCADMIKAIEAGGDYVRDVSIPVGSDARAAAWVHPHCPVTPAASLPASFVAPRVACTSSAARFPGRAAVWFNENDCGGVFDGRGVVSDADPGL